MKGIFFINYFYLSLFSKNNNMKKVIMGLIVVLLVSSCSRYSYPSYDGIGCRFGVRKFYGEPRVIKMW
jgi:hypothetical protein